MERALGQTAALLPTLAQRRPLIKRIAGSIAVWLRNGRTRRQLARLDERQLADAGISLCERDVELSKPFWRE